MEEWRQVSQMNKLFFYKLESFYIFKLFTFFDSEFLLCKGFPGGSDGKEFTYNAGDMGLIPG